MKSAIYFLSKLFFYGSLMLLIFIILFSLLSLLEGVFDIDIPLIDVFEEQHRTRTRISIPFVGTYIEVADTFLIPFMCLFFCFYTFYFYALSEFFKVFIKIDVFTEDSIKKLKRFGALNFIPIGFASIVILMDVIRGIVFKMDTEYGLAILHLFIAFFIYFYLDLIKKGKLIKEENDLTI